MVSEQEVASFAREVGQKFRPEKIILFGSHAAGRAQEDSDVDVLVIMEHKGRAARQALEIRRSVKKSFPLDLLVQSPGEVRRRLEAGDPFITESLANGRVLYESGEKSAPHSASTWMTDDKQPPDNAAIYRKCRSMRSFHRKPP